MHYDLLDMLHIVKIFYNIYNIYLKHFIRIFHTYDLHTKQPEKRSPFQSNKFSLSSKLGCIVTLDPCIHNTAAAKYPCQS